MCGIGGVFSDQKITNKFTKKCAQIIKHRGPDNTSFYEENENLNFVHCRLSILDTSELGNQPIKSSNGNYILIFNGEIYNYRELRAVLKQEGYKFNGDSDTEVLVNYFEYAGIKKTIEDINGMYAIALFDLTENIMYLMRDKYGEKPLFFYQFNNSIYFCSEAKIFKEYFNTAVNSESVEEYVQCGFRINTQSVFKGVKSLKPNQILKCIYSDSKLCINEIKLNHNYNKLRADKKSNLKDVLYKVVEDTMVSDVPIGAFLSGGIDSSLIVKIMSDINGGKINTFTVGFKNSNYDESRFARAVGKYNKTNHNEIILDEDDIAETIKKIPNLLDEPILDMSFIPTYLVSKMASEKVKVCLSGDGGDELFFGYNRYIYANKILNSTKYIPKFMTKFLSLYIQSKTISQWDYIYSKLKSPLQVQMFGERLHKLSSLLNSKSELSSFYLSFFGNDSIEINTEVVDKEYSRMKNISENISSLDRSFYLPNNILIKSDRASMLNGLEVRSPFLNKEISDYVQKTKSKSYKDNLGKKELRNLLNELMPDYEKITNRNKMGFALPVEDVLKKQLNCWVKNLITINSPIDNRYSLRVYEDFMKGDSSKIHKLWRIVIFNSWYRNNYINQMEL